MDCEWMFGDAATGLLGFAPLAGLNPLRWSGSVTFDEAIKQIRDAQSHKDRPIICKSPSGVLSKEHRFENCEKAIEFLQQACHRAADSFGSEKAKEEDRKVKEDVLQRAQEAEQAQMPIWEDLDAKLKEANKEYDSIDHEKVASDLQLSWMFGDAGRHTFGFDKAKINPFRWSPTQSVEKSREDWEKADAMEKRPICIKIVNPPEEKTFATSQEALDHLYASSMPHRQWNERRSAAKIELDKAQLAFDVEDTKLKALKEEVRKAKKALEPEVKLVFHIGTNNWQRQGEFAPGSGILHASMHHTMNNMEGVRCYSIYPSKNQTDPTDDDTFRIFKLKHDIPICESISPSSNYRWHTMNDEEFAAYRKRLEDEVCAFMDEIEKKEEREFDYLISHHAFTNAMAGAQIVERRAKEGKTKLKHFNFVHGTALKMYIKEKEGDPEYPMRFLKICQDHGTFTGDSLTKGVWVNSEDYIQKFADCFPSYPKNKLVFSRIGVNQDIFKPVGSKPSKDLVKHLTSAKDREKLTDVKRAVTFVGKFADWKRLDAVLIAAAAYEKDYPDLVTIIAGSGPDADVKKYHDMAERLGLQRTVFVGNKQQPELAELYSMSEVGMFPSYKEPFGMVFIECMACGTPVIGANSGGPTEFVRADQGVLIAEEADWHSEAGMKKLGDRLADTVRQAINEDWKGNSKGPTCIDFVTNNFSTTKQCSEMLHNMEVWGK